MNAKPVDGMINLLPVSRQIRNARSTAVSRWTSACVIVAAAAFIPASALALNAEDDLGPVNARIQRSQEAIARIRAERPPLEAELISLRARSRVLDSVQSGIDWLPLLGAISDVASPARFDQIELRFNEAESRIDVRMIGLVETMSESRELVLRLEQIEPLQNLTMTTSKVKMQQEVYRFDIAGWVRSGGS